MSSTPIVPPSPSVDEPNPRAILNAAVYDLRVIGCVFVFLGAAMMAIFAADRRMSTMVQIAVMADSVMLFGPGVWYLFAGTYLKRLQPRAVKVSFYVAAAQVAVILLALLFAILTGGRRDGGMIAAPAIVAIFFIPALIAVLFSLRRAGRMIALLDPAGHAFEVQPTFTESSPPPPQMPILSEMPQLPSDSVREK